MNTSFVIKGTNVVGPGACTALVPVKNNLPAIKKGSGKLATLTQDVVQFTKKMPKKGKIALIAAAAAAGIGAIASMFTKKSEAPEGKIPLEEGNPELLNQTLGE